MSEPSIVFDGVWKKFRRGERHDSLRDLIPGAIGGLLRRGVKTDALAKDEFWILQNVSFEVKPGEALGIIGQNGAGKSTTLKLLTGILRPTLGHAHVRGRVGALIEIAAGFHPDLTGRENVYLQGAIMGMKREEIRRHFDAIVAFSGIEEFIDTPVKRYSSGMNARLGFSIAAHLEPDVLLIDEVLAVGDFTFQQKCYERLKEFRRGGTAIAFVSHNMQAVATLCERALLLRPNQAPIVNEVSLVTAMYAKGGAVSADPRVRTNQIELLLSRTQQAPPAAIAPGERLDLKLDLTALEPLPRCGVLLQITRSDGVVMFAGMSTLDGLQPLQFAENATLHATIGFTANLLRGTYSLSVHLVDDQRRWSPVILTGVASFVVTETTRSGGMVEVKPEYSLTVTSGAVAQQVRD